MTVHAAARRSAGLRPRVSSALVARSIRADPETTRRRLEALRVDVLARGRDGRTGRWPRTPDPRSRRPRRRTWSACADALAMLERCGILQVATRRRSTRSTGPEAAPVLALPVASPCGVAIVSAAVRGDSMRRSMWARGGPGRWAWSPSVRRAWRRKPRRASPAATAAQPAMHPAPARRANEGFGPYKKMVIRRRHPDRRHGRAARGPVDIVIENDKITDVLQAGWPGMPLKPKRRPTDADHEIDATGMYALPGFVDLHTDGDPVKSPDLEYAYKLWLAHGVTTVRGVSLAPAGPGQFREGPPAPAARSSPRASSTTRPWARAGPAGASTGPAKARAWVQWAAKNSIDGIKFFGWNDETPEVMIAAIDEAKKVGLGTVAHISQPGVAGLNAPVRRGRSRNRHPLLRPFRIDAGERPAAEARTTTTSTTRPSGSAKPPRSGTRWSRGRRPGSTT